MPVEANEDQCLTPVVRTNKDIPTHYKYAVFQTFRAMAKHGQLPRGSFTKVAREHKLASHTVTVIWQTGLKNLSIHGPHAPPCMLFPSHRNKCGRKIVHNRAALKEKFRSTHYKKRATSWDAARVLGISQRHFLRLMNTGLFRTATSRIKPKISPENMQKRVEFAKSQILPPVAEDGIQVEYYDPQYDTIYLDEKWFYECPVKRRFYLCNDEAVPEKYRRSKNHLTKVMFISAVARPWKTADPTAAATVQVSEDTDWYFNGKVGLFPLVDYKTQQRTTQVRARGDMYPVTLSLTGDVYSNYIINIILPDVAKKCPPEMKSKEIKLIHDNATPHSKIDMQKFNEKCAILGINATINYQPPQSPDLNINDLSFFASVQSLYYKQTEVQITSIETLIEAMDYTYAQFNPIKLNRAYLTLFTNYNAIIQSDGKNNYKIKHMSKEMLERKGLLPTKMVVQRFPELQLRDIIEFDVVDGENDDFDLFSVINEEELQVVPELAATAVEEVATGAENERKDADDNNSDLEREEDEFDRSKSYHVFDDEISEVVFL
jgi:hypothetical protein